MPESRKRQRAAYTAPTASGTRKRPPSPPWFGVSIAALFLIGIVYLLLYYVTNGEVPIKALNGWNIFVGFGFIVAGFGLLTQWR